ncbi:MAG TPA: helix-turn-helix domain-containing protein [Acetobacteraceae bacterium]|nr:helix-turn-helix domain-containing protein [Acetobacteraceae bacterium]
MASDRRLGVESSKVRALLVEAADQLMVEEGHQAVSARRVAERAALKPQLVHYYFRSMDDLFIAVFRRATERYLALHEQALAAPQPLRALWELNSDSSGTKRNMEFIALASHRDAVRAEIVQSATFFRTLQIAAVARVLAARGIDTEAFPAAGVTLLMSAISRALVTETTLGISLAHTELLAIVNRFLELAEPREAAPGH